MLKDLLECIVNVYHLEVKEKRKNESMNSVYYACTMTNISFSIPQTEWNKRKATIVIAFNKLWFINL